MLMVNLTKMFLMNYYPRLEGIKKNTFLPGKNKRMMSCVWTINVILV